MTAQTQLGRFGGVAAPGETITAIEQLRAAVAATNEVVEPKHASANVHGVPAGVLIYYAATEAVDVHTLGGVAQAGTIVVELDDCNFGVALFGPRDQDLFELLAKLIDERTGA